MTAAVYFTEGFLVRRGDTLSFQFRQQAHNSQDRLPKNTWDSLCVDLSKFAVHTTSDRCQGRSAGAMGRTLALLVVALAVSCCALRMVSCYSDAPNQQTGTKPLLGITVTEPTGEQICPVHAKGPLRSTCHEHSMIKNDQAGLLLVLIMARRQYLQHSTTPIGARVGHA